ncbi:MAG: uroporphyrinogen decarboxylase family protein [Desulfobacteraceae bacterium]|jgi:[methyl-Co(III) methanol-specific corrinoid protein]:coenzyme M methyltransferase
MVSLSSRERVLRFFAKEPIDTMPCFSGQGMVTVPAIEALGIRFPSIHLTGENMAGSAIRSMEMFGFDSVVVPYDMCTIPQAFGLGVSIYEDSEDILYPTIPTKWSTPDEVEIPGDYLQSARMPVVDQAMSLLKEKVGKTHAIGTWVLGPFTLAGQLVELDVLMKMTLKEKDKVEALLDKLTELIIELGRHYREIGADYVNLREMGTGADILSPRVFKTIVQPRLRQIFEAWDSPKILHICGSTDLIIELMNDCGAEAISVDHKNTLSETRQKIGDQVILLGDYDGFTLPGRSSPEEIKAAIQKCIDDGVDAVWPGCDIWPDIRSENLKLINDTIKELGGVATPSVGRL